MLSKKILLAGIAAGALAVAGSASALTLSGTTVGGVQVVSTTTVTPYVVASEAKGPFSTTPGTAGTTVTTAGSGTTQLVANLSTGSLASGGQYLVTYGITGASFGSAITSSSLICGTTAAPTCTVAVQSSSASSVTFLVTTTNATSSFTFAAPFTLTTGGAVSVSAQVALANSPATTIDNGVVTASIISSKSGFLVANGTTNPATSGYASVASGFKKFNSSSLPNTGTDAASYVIGGIQITPVASTYRDLNGTLVAQSDVVGDAVTVNGNLGSSETLSLVGSTTTGANAGTATTATVTSAQGSGTIPAASFTYSAATSNGVPNQAVTLAQAGSASLSVSGYTLNVQPTLSNAYNAPLPTSLTEGSIFYQGTTILAPWVGDGSNGYNAIVRIANQSSTIIPGVTAQLLSPVNATSGSAGTAQQGTCQLGTIAASTSFTVSSSQLASCFGNFGNADVLISVQAGYSSLSAKLRIINASTGVVTEQSLGSGQGASFGSAVANTYNTTGVATGTSVTSPY